MTNNLEAQKRYAARMESIKNSLERLNEASKSDFNVKNEDATWCDVTMAHYIDSKLKEICNQFFHKGEDVE